MLCTNLNTAKAGAGLASNIVPGVMEYGIFDDFRFSDIKLLCHQALSECGTWVCKSDGFRSHPTFKSKKITLFD